MEKRKCKICGQQKTEAEFSKSYRGQCKECVARKTRESRAASRTAVESEAEYIRIPGTCLDDSPNWEQRRYEIAKEIFVRLMSHEDGDVRAFSNREIKMTAAECVRDAEALIAELKKSEKKGDNK